METPTDRLPDPTHEPSPTRLEGMETRGEGTGAGVAAESPTRLEGMETA